ncbi:MAG: hypothetical protein AABX07_05675 [Nanoarchaeota archaeon]
MKIINDFRNELLNRREAKAIVESENNPSFQSAVKMISEQFKAVEELIAIKRISGKFGRDSFLLEAFIYDSIKDKENKEPRKRIKVKKEGEAK